MGALVMKAEGLPAHELGEIEVRAQGSFKQMQAALAACFAPLLPPNNGHPG
jgi:hypothetical protein